MKNILRWYGMNEKKWDKEFRKGGIQLCVLSLLSREKKYGFQIIKELEKKSDGYYKLKEGTLYPILHRLKERQYLSSEWVIDEPNPPRKYYFLTDEGRRELKTARKQWKIMVYGTNKILEGS